MFFVLHVISAWRNPPCIGGLLELSICKLGNHHVICDFDCFFVLGVAHATVVVIGKSELGSHHVICEVPCICRHALAFQMSSLSQQHGIPQLIEIEEAHGETDC